MQNLDSFTRAYITTALWSSMDDNCTPLDSNYGASDIHPDTLTRMAADCQAFREANSETISQAIETGKVVCGPDFNEWERAAHDLWLTRNHNGAGFWDGDWPEPFATQLADAAHAMGGFNLYVGDDGMIHGS